MCHEVTGGTLHPAYDPDLWKLSWSHDDPRSCGYAFARRAGGTNHSAKRLTAKAGGEWTQRMPAPCIAKVTKVTVANYVTFVQVFPVVFGTLTPLFPTHTIGFESR